MRLHLHLPSLPAGLSIIIFSIILFAAHIRPACSIPQSLGTRQSSFRALQLPQCALTCFLTSILSDGCANELDFKCHCAPENILKNLTVCINEGCNKVDKEEAMAKLETACVVVGGGSQGQSMSGGGISTTLTSTASAGPVSTGSQVQPSPSSQLSSSFSLSSLNLPPTPAPVLSSTATSSPPTAVLSPSSVPSSTEPPLAVLPAPQLSDGAKAGISVSVSFLALAMFFALGWYIRRLKRNLTAAQDLSDDMWRASMNTVDVPSPPGSGRERRSKSEVVMISDNGYGVLMKKRGHVLSVVVEGDEESRPASTREPRSIQSERLSEPLEFDNGGRSRADMPLSISPQDESLERARL